LVPFVRVTRDKRGYEQIYLMRATGRRGKSSAPRVLYVFRTPPGVKLGREPFDETARRTIEEQNPGVYFDWKKLSVIAPPSDVEYWRERRRAQKAAKQALREEERARAAAPGEPEGAQGAPASRDQSDGVESLAESESDGAEGAGLDARADEAAGEAGDLETEGEDDQAGDDRSQGPAEVQSLPAQGPGAQSQPGGGRRRRRRRRGGRGRGRHPNPDQPAALSGDSPKVTDEPSKER
jgi:hypothetical protein